MKNKEKITNIDVVLDNNQNTNPNNTKTESAVNINKNDAKTKKEKPSKTQQNKIEQEEKNKKKLPSYTKGEELFNAISHIVGGAFAIVALVLGIVIASHSQNKFAMRSAIVLGIGLLLMFCASSIYHFLARNKAKRLFRIFDHCAIFVLIASTYTPYCLMTIGGTYGAVLLSVVWFFAILGITFNAINMHSKVVKVLSQISYLVLGWCVLFFIIPLYKSIDFSGFLLLLFGGIAYSIGAIFYACGKKKKYIHSVWHLFVLVGSILQTLSILLFVL